VEYSKGMLPKTDSIISRAVNISIGVFDVGLGSGFGITLTSNDNEVDQRIEEFRMVTEKYL